ncbi:MAG: hypothetical protein LQ339_006405 [Xanthoria mediterranea]|nr:MAG: hypothetical protein LQ339_006405 [Xanthoria mediterranea]
MSELRTNQDYRLSYGSDAPEIDHAICAPEYRTDNTAPEVAPGRDAQVYHSTSPPEATEIDVPEPNDQLSATHDAPTSRSQKKFLIRIIVLAIIIGVSLSVGLSVGLKSRKNEAKSRNDNTG